MNILMPISAKSSFFPIEDFPFPKPLIEIDGITMIERVVENLKSIGDNITFTFVISHDDAINFSLDKTLSLITDDHCNVVILNAPTKGALCSCLLAIDHIDPSEPLVIVNGDQIISESLAEIIKHFINEGADAGVISMSSVHPRWSYVKLDENQTVLQAEEKKVISKNALTGFFFYKNGQIFIDAAMSAIETDNSLNGQFYIAPSLNEIIIKGMKILSYPIENAHFYSFYSPAKIDEFKDHIHSKSIDSSFWADQQMEKLPPLNIIIPAAGEGSRFADAGYKQPKPYIDVLGKPMIKHVMDNLAIDTANMCLLLRKDHMAQEAEITKNIRSQGTVIIEVDKLTEGTACTALLARGEFDNYAPMMIANSDQIVDFNAQAFVDDCLKRGLDGSILVFKNPDKDTKWSYAKLDDHGYVTEVAEKKAISDLATVGIYLFARGSDFVKSAVDMIARNDRVRNEFYTCPVYNYMIKQGHKIGVYEIPIDAMHGLGTPDDLDKYLALKTK